MGWHVNPLRDAQGRVTHFVSTQRDITERRREEERLRERAALLDQARNPLQGDVLLLVGVVELAVRVFFYEMHRPWI